jgi:hypothetical protein
MVTRTRRSVLRSGSRKAGQPDEPIVRQTLLWTILGVIACIVGVAVAVMSDGVPTAPASGTQSAHISGNNNTVNNFQEFEQKLGGQTDEARVRAAAREFVDVPPGAEGPWPFVVAGVGDVGLIVRTSGERSGRQIGSAGNGATVWAQCLLDTGFNPSGTNRQGSSWAMIRWPNRVPVRTFFNSAPTDPAQGWVYVGYLVPAGHNGHIPDC